MCIAPAPARVGMQLLQGAPQDRARLPRCCQQKAATEEEKNLGFASMRMVERDVPEMPVLAKCLKPAIRLG